MKKTGKGIRESISKKSKALLKKLRNSPEFKKDHEDLRYWYLEYIETEHEVENTPDGPARNDVAKRLQQLKGIFEATYKVFCTKHVDLPFPFYASDWPGVIRYLDELSKSGVEIDLSWKWLVDNGQVDYWLEDDGYVHLKIGTPLMVPEDELLDFIKKVIRVASFASPVKWSKRDRSDEDLQALNVWEEWNRMGRPEFKRLAATMGIPQSTAKSRWYKAFKLIYGEYYRKIENKYSREKLSTDMTKTGKESNFIDDTSINDTLYHEEELNVEERVIERQFDSIFSVFTDYVKDQRMRISYLRDISNAETKVELANIRRKMEREYGKLPPLVNVIFTEGQKHLPKVNQ